MTVLTIAAINLQSSVASTRNHFHYALTGWKYWLPHSHQPIAEAGQMLREENVEIACITEISAKSLRTGFRSQTKTLADAAHMEHAHFFSSQKIGKFFFHEGNALFSKYPIGNFASHLLPIELMRMSLEETTVEVEGRKITVFIAHLALSQKWRQLQYKKIIELLKERRGPIILAGDFNERDPGALTILTEQTPLKHVCTLKTFPSWDPKYPLDYILLSGEFDVLDCYIPTSPAFSDHAPLIVKAKLT